MAEFLIGEALLDRLDRQEAEAVADLREQAQPVREPRPGDLRAQHEARMAELRRGG